MKIHSRELLTIQHILFRIMAPFPEWKNNQLGLSIPCLVSKVCFHAPSSLCPPPLMTKYATYVIWSQSGPLPSPHWKTPFEVWLSLWHSSLELPFGTHFAKIPGDSDSDFRKYTLMILCPRLVQWSFQGVNLENISEQSRLVSRLLNHTMWTPSSLRCDHNTRYDYPVFIYWTLPACSAAKQPFYTIASFIAWKCSETSIAFLPLQAKTRRLGEVKQLI